MLVGKNEIKRIISSSHDNDGYDCEIWYKGKCAIVVSINDKGVSEVLFADIQHLEFEYTEFLELINDSKKIVEQKYNDFKKNKL